MGKKMTALLLSLASGGVLVAAGELSNLISGKMDIYLLVFWILLFIAIPLNFFVFFKRVKSGVRKGTGYLPVSILASVFLLGGAYMYLEAVVQAGRLYGKLLLFALPLFSTLLVLLTRKEKTTAAKIAASIIAATGAALLIFSKIAPPGDFSTAGFLFAVGGSAAFAIFILLSTGTRAGAPVKSYVYVNAGTLFALFMVLVKSRFSFPAPELIIHLLIWSAITVLLIYLPVAASYAAGASYWGVAAYTVSVVVFLYGILFKSASSSVFELIGLGIVTFAVMYRGALKS